MKRSDLKEIIKPIVQECVKESVEEILLESGLLSSVIKEVMKGALPALVESKQTQNQQKQPVKQPNNHLLEQLRKEKEETVSDFKKQNAEINKSISMKIGNVDVFKDTKPAPPEKVTESLHSPLSGVDPSDPGVDLGRLFGNKKFSIMK
jgi:hypothetical protein